MKKQKRKLEAEFTDDELAEGFQQLCENWDTLPPEIRQAIMSYVDNATTKLDEFNWRPRQKKPSKPRARRSPGKSRGN